MEAVCFPVEEVVRREIAMKVYVASSWRNPYQPEVVRALRNAGHEVYDFRNPKPGDSGFHWSEIDPEWQRWSPEQYGRALMHPLAVAGFESDMEALRSAEAVVLVLPCGRSAHLELGWACGAGKRSAVLMVQREEPELMYRMVDILCYCVGAVVGWVNGLEGKGRKKAHFPKKTLE